MEYEKYAPISNETAVMRCSPNQKFIIKEGHSGYSSNYYYFGQYSLPQTRTIYLTMK